MEQYGPVRARYAKLAADRESYLTRARDAAKVTIPTLVPPSGATNSTKYPTPFQGLGARGLNNLASKLLLALFPPNSPFFRLTLPGSEYEKNTQNKDQAGDLKTEVEDTLSRLEVRIKEEIESSNIRVRAFEGMKQLLVAGNVLLYLQPEGGMRIYKLNQYVVKRSPNGKVLEIIIEEEVSPQSLDPAVLFQAEVETDSNGQYKQKTLKLYTSVKWDNVLAQYEIQQELNNKPLVDVYGTFPEDVMPWIPLRFTSIDGEDYGRGYIEEYLGDLRSLEALTQAIVEGSAAAAKMVVLVNPNGVTRKEDLVKAPNTGVIPGVETDVTAFQANKFNDFRVAKDTINDLKEQLGYAFLLNSSIQRNGERVTAEEIRYMARELEDALGGVYSVLSLEFQLPLVRVLMQRMQQRKLLPKLPKDSVRLKITTGLEALGRSSDLAKQGQLLEHLQVFGPETVGKWINIPNWVTRVASNLGINAEGLVKSEQQVQAEEQQRAMMEAQAQQQLAQAQQAQGGPGGPPQA
jgi:hypothetical protein